MLGQDLIEKGCELINTVFNSNYYEEMQEYCSTHIDAIKVWRDIYPSHYAICQQFYDRSEFCRIPLSGYVMASCQPFQVSFKDVIYNITASVYMEKYGNLFAGGAYAAGALASFWAYQHYSTRASAAPAGVALYSASDISEVELDGFDQLLEQLKSVIPTSAKGLELKDELGTLCKDKRAVNEFSIKVLLNHASQLAQSTSNQLLLAFLIDYINIIPGQMREAFKQEVNQSELLKILLAKKNERFIELLITTDFISNENVRFIIREAISQDLPIAFNAAYRKLVNDNRFEDINMDCLQLAVIQNKEKVVEALVRDHGVEITSGLVALALETNGSFAQAKRLIELMAPLCVDDLNYLKFVLPSLQDSRLIKSLSTYQKLDRRVCLLSVEYKTCSDAQLLAAMQHCVLTPEQQCDMIHYIFEIRSQRNDCVKVFSDYVTGLGLEEKKKLANAFRERGDVENAYSIYKFLLKEISLSEKMKHDVHTKCAELLLAYPSLVSTEADVSESKPENETVESTNAIYDALLVDALESEIYLSEDIMNEIQAQCAQLLVSYPSLSCQSSCQEKDKENTAVPDGLADNRIEALMHAAKADNKDLTRRIARTLQF